MKKFKIIAASIALSLVSTIASASTMAPTENFYKFYEFIDTSLNGPLGLGLAFTALLIGGGIGAAKSSAMPALTGIVIAAFFGFGPGVAADLMSIDTAIIPLI